MVAGELAVRVAAPPAQGPTAEEVRRVLLAIPKDSYRFLTAENSEEYATIAYVLYWNRRYGLNEVQHDDLRRDSEAVLAAMTGGSLEEGRFQAMLDYLYEWGVIDRRVATMNIRSIRDWRRNINQYWLTEDAYRLFEMLEYAESLKSRQISGAEGRDYVRIVEERLARLAQDVDSIPRASTEDQRTERAETLRQLYHSLTLLHANEFRQFKDFLTNLNAALIEFGRRPHVDMQELPQVRLWLEAYVREMLVYFRERSARIVKHARAIRDSHNMPLLHLGHELAIQMATTPFSRPSSASHPAPELVLLSFIQFFDKRQGLDQQARRIKESTAETARRLEEHYQRLAETSQVLELLRLRTHEILATDPTNDARQRDVAAWTANLFLPRSVQWAPRLGTQEAQGAPPRPGRYHENRRPPITTAGVHRPTGDASGALRVNEERAGKINDFVESKILRGADSADLRTLSLDTLDDFRILLAAVKYDRLHLASPISRHFIFIVEDTRRHPHDPLVLLTWIGEDGEYTGPNLRVRRKDSAGAHA